MSNIGFEQLFSYFPNQAEQQLVQLSKITSPEIAKTLMSFSGSENCAEKALEWLHLRWGNPHLQLPAVYNEIKNLQPAKSQADIPKAAERVLSKIEALSSLKDDTQPLPSDVTTTIFRALHLSTEEKKGSFATPGEARWTIHGGNEKIYIKKVQKL